MLSASCGIEPGRVVAYKPLLDEAIALASHKPGALRRFCSGPRKRGRPRPWPRPTRLGGRVATGARIRHRRSAVVHANGPALHPLHLGHDRAAQGRRARQRRPSGRALPGACATSTAWSPARCSGRPRTSAGSSGTPTSCTRPLLHGCTTVLYEGKPVGTPDAGAFWRVIAEHGVNALFTARPPSARSSARTRREADRELRPVEFRTLFLAGERADPDTLHWARSMLGVPVIDHWWQTETGWPIAPTAWASSACRSSTAPPPEARAGLRRPRPRRAMASESRRARPAHIVLKLPLPPGCLPTLCGRTTRALRRRPTLERSFPGYYQTADAGHIDEDGYLWIMARTDDIINVAGHRLSTGGMEEVLAAHPDVAECAVVGVDRRAEGPGARGPRGPEGRRVARPTRPRSQLGAGGTRSRRADRSGRRLQDRGGSRAAAEDPLGQSAPRDDARHRRRPRPTGRRATIDDPAILDEIREALGALGLPG